MFSGVLFVGHCVMSSNDHIVTATGEHISMQRSKEIRYQLEFNGECRCLVNYLFLSSLLKVLNTVSLKLCKGKGKRRFV